MSMKCEVCGCEETVDHLIGNHHSCRECSNLHVAYWEVLGKAYDSGDVSSLRKWLEDRLESLPPPEVPDGE